ncbi:uncharacterized protein PAC_17700 [Phialocephala subalpina]|uniref:Uncharacterized protein n=1 Tax=Phialocephala subalpina TaxID=576137 RepID=A0A1L7XRW5_9HELO|nr:uncharacterized protein PAC_17700 [Phialocephala subalpina]
MHFTRSLLLYVAWMLYAATTASASCNANNCLRGLPPAIRASAFPTRPGTADCSSYFMVTVSTSTVSNTQTITVVSETITPTAIPAYASDCEGSTGYSSACSCIGVTQATTTIGASSTPINTANGYAIVSPNSCPSPVAPTGTPIGQSNSSFSDEFGGLQYQQFPGSEFIISNGNDTLYVDLSSPHAAVISDSSGDTLIMYDNGTFVAFLANCGLEIVSTWPLPSAPADKARRAGGELEARQASGVLCNAVQFFCNDWRGVGLAALATSVGCHAIGAAIGQVVGGGIGFLGNALGPEVGIPATILGVVVGKKYGEYACNVGVAILLFELCKACPATNCPPGTISCNGGPCQDALSDPNNCESCGNVCPSGVCINAQCSAPVCAGSTCNSLNSCGGSCFCFETADGTGFCGPSESCSPLPDCNLTQDCQQGWVCATGTCCGRNVCLQACGVALARRELAVGGNATELYTNGWVNLGL